MQMCFAPDVEEEICALEATGLCQRPEGWIPLQSIVSLAPVPQHAGQPVRSNHNPTPTPVRR
jgi:hypothetical protein